MYNLGKRKVIIHPAIVFWKPENGRVFDKDIALDVETELIDDRQPSRIPRMVVAGAHDGQRTVLLTVDTIGEFLRAHTDLTVIMHNAAFDLAVIDQAIGENFDVYALVDAGLVRDTMILHRLYELATTGNAQWDGSSLADSCRKHLGIEVEKKLTDSSGRDVRTSYSHWIARPTEIPMQYKVYLDNDVSATYRLDQHFRRCFKRLAGTICRARPFGFIDEHRLREAWEQYGPLTHDIQLKAAIVLEEIRRNGLRVDISRLAAFHRQLQAERKDVLLALLPLGYRPGKGSLSALQQILHREEQGDGEIRFPRTETGKISTSAENLEPYEGIIPFVGLYLRFKRIEKLLGSFLNKMRKGTLHPTFDVLKNTGRTSAFGEISAQNLPRDERVRELFVAPHGSVFIDADYAAVEMATLAQAMLTQFGGRSAMAEAINNEIDVHRLIASRMTGKIEAEISANERQKAKAVNFGLPGGMGLKTFRQYAKTNYGIDLSEHEARRLTETWFNTFPEMRRFLDKSGNLGAEIACFLSIIPSDYLQATFRYLPSDANTAAMLGWMARKVYQTEMPGTNAGRSYDETERDFFWERLDMISDRLGEKLQKAVRERKPSQELARGVCRLASQSGVLTLTGRLRANATYCARHNTIFQGLAADGAKLAMWKLWRNGFRIVNFIHDEFLVEVEEQQDYTEVAETIKQLMIEGMREIVPDVRIGVECAVSRRWSKTVKGV